MEERSVAMSSSVQVSRSFTATSLWKLVLSRSKGLVDCDGDEVIIGEGVDTIREVEGIGEEGGE